MSRTACLTFGSAIGRLGVVAGEEAVIGVRFSALPEDERGGPAAAEALCRRARDEIVAYLAGRLRLFSVPIEPRGPSFHRHVWSAMVEIPYGDTVSYGELARRVDHPDAVRAVGRACGANPIPLIIPCHRVLAAGGRIGGFGGGVDVKRWLLDLEAGLPRLF